jgi:hypothetical protein
MCLPTDKHQREVTRRMIATTNVDFGNQNEYGSAIGKTNADQIQTTGTTEKAEKNNRDYVAKMTNTKI